MSDLRWSDCDDLAYQGQPLEALLCRTSRLNDHAHQTDLALAKLKASVHWFGLVTTGLSLLGVIVGLAKALHG